MAMVRFKASAGNLSRVKSAARPWDGVGESAQSFCSQVQRWRWQGEGTGPPREPLRLLSDALGQLRAGGCGVGREDSVAGAGCVHGRRGGGPGPRDAQSGARGQRGQQQQLPGHPPARGAATAVRAGPQRDEARLRRYTDAPSPRPDRQAAPKPQPPRDPAAGHAPSRHRVERLERPPPPPSRKRAGRWVWLREPVLTQAPLTRVLA